MCSRGVTLPGRLPRFLADMEVQTSFFEFVFTTEEGGEGVTSWSSFCAGSFVQLLFYGGFYFWLHLHLPITSSPRTAFLIM